MKKTEKNETKDKARIKGRVWIDEHTPYKKRKYGSGLTFSGKYKSEAEK